MNEIMNIPQPIDKSSYTDNALSMLSCIMQKVTYETVSAINKKPDFYDSMCAIAISLASSINQIENNAAPLETMYTDDDVIQLDIQ